MSRRRFVAGLAATGALAACSGSDAATSTIEPATIEPGSFTIVQRFPNNVQLAGRVRMPISLSTGAAEFIVDGPETLSAQIVDSAGANVGDRITAVKRVVAPVPYYDFRATVDTPGIYALIVDGGPVDGASFQVMEPGTVAVPSPGELLAGFDTPTTGDAAGVDPICTRTPEPCPFHTLTLADALNVDRPVVYYVGTPAFCSTGSCAPALEALIDSRERFGDTFTFVHAEVFADPAGTVISPALEALGLTYEPTVFITNADGVIQERLDAVWDRTEFEEALERVSS